MRFGIEVLRRKINFYKKAVVILSPMFGREMPPSELGKYREDLLMGSKAEKFHKNLKRRVVRVLIFFGVGRMILDRKRILGRKC